jgi:hypothetical protein
MNIYWIKCELMLLNLYCCIIDGKQIYELCIWRRVTYSQYQQKSIFQRRRNYETYMNENKDRYELRMNDERKELWREVRLMNEDKLSELC